MVSAFASSSREIKYVTHQVGVKRTYHLETCLCVICVYAWVYMNLALISIHHFSLTVWFFWSYLKSFICVMNNISTHTHHSFSHYDNFHFHQIFFILRWVLFSLLLLFLFLLPNSIVIPAMTFIVTLWAWEFAQWAVTSYNLYGKISCQIKPIYRS